jgi:hypothetical protein
METVLAVPHHHESLSWQIGDNSLSGSADPSSLTDDGDLDGNWMESTHQIQMHIEQLSPISNDMDGSIDDSSAPTMIHSASSTCTDTWSTGTGHGEQDDMDHDIHWEQGSDDVLTVPKVEPVDDDDFDFNDLKQAPKSTDTAPNASEEGVQKKRPRGRPRKHPLTPAVSTNKVTKGRSKTGCITCRKRKKKCDEAKPRCETIPSLLIGSSHTD